jgi:hypothetical protein
VGPFPTNASSRVTWAAQCGSRWEEDRRGGEKGASGEQQKHHRQSHSTPLSWWRTEFTLPSYHLHVTSIFYHGQNSGSTEIYLRFSIPILIFMSRSRYDVATTTVLLDATGLSRGHFWLNGHDLGKFWTIKGPSGQLTQRYYHLPSALLKPMPGSRCAVWHLGGSPF